MSVNGWIVNEAGDDIKIVDGTGTDGCKYVFPVSGDGVWRIVPDEHGDRVAGEFDFHEQPFSGKE